MSKEPDELAVEREHCRAVFERDMRPLSGVQDKHVEFLVRERAQRFADGYAAGRADQSKVPCTSHHEALLAAQSEIERYKSAVTELEETRVRLLTEIRTLVSENKAAQEYVAKSDALFRETAAKLDDEHAEAELKQAALNGVSATSDNLAAKLKNLRAVCSRCLDAGLPVDLESELRMAMDAARIP